MFLLLLGMKLFSWHDTKITIKLSIYLSLILVLAFLYRYNTGLLTLTMNWDFSGS
jgi:hypothetical protein